MTDALAVDEGRRQAYLAALGIPLWGARVELPGALPGEPLGFVPWIVGTDEADASPRESSLVAAPARSEPAGPVPAAPAAGPSVPDAPMATRASAPGPGSADADPVAPRRQAPAVSPAAPAAASIADPAADTRAPRLGCRAWSLAPGLSALIDQGDAPDLSAVEHRLLANIALALEAPEPPGALGNLLRWPLNANPRLDHGPTAMQAWLAHALRLPAGRCLVFGAALAGHVRAARPDLELIAVPALAELLAEADAKRRFWRALHG